MTQFNLQDFIQNHVIHRTVSLFQEDLVEHDKTLHERLNNQRVLVIGGAGSIGSAFIKALLHYNICRLVVVDINENGLASLTRDLRNNPDLKLPLEFVSYPMDFGSMPFQRMFLNSAGFDVVANFAALKHVRSEKDIYSIEAMFDTNVIKAHQLLTLLEQKPPKRYFSVSTDKATNPVNLMGASKRVMEDVVFSFQDKFVVTTARFANVAFSNGSLPASFIDRFAMRQPLSAPTNLKRYFVSGEESGQLCLLACMLGDSGEIFFPKLKQEQMAGFDQIATDYLIAQGYEPYHCNNEHEAWELLPNLIDKKKYPVLFSPPTTSGEKPYEEFYTDTERIQLDKYHQLGVVLDSKQNTLSTSEFLQQLTDAFSSPSVSKNSIVSLVASYIPSFMHSETGQNLDSKI